MYLNNHYFYYKCFLKTPCVIKRTRCGLYLHVKIWFAMLQSTFLSTVLITVLGAKVFQHIVQDYNKYVHVNKKYMAIVLKYPKKNYHTCIFLLCTAWHDTNACSLVSNLKVFNCGCKYESHTVKLELTPTR